MPFIIISAINSYLYVRLSVLVSKHLLVLLTLGLGREYEYPLGGRVRPPVLECEPEASCRAAPIRCDHERRVLRPRRGYRTEVYAPHPPPALGAGLKSPRPLMLARLGRPPPLLPPLLLPPPPRPKAGGLPIPSFFFLFFASGLNIVCARVRGATAKARRDERVEGEIRTALTRSRGRGARAAYLEEQLNEVQDAPKNVGDYGDPVIKQRAAWTRTNGVSRAPVRAPACGRSELPEIGALLQDRAVGFEVRHARRDTLLGRTVSAGSASATRPRVGRLVPTPSRLRYLNIFQNSPSSFNRVSPRLLTCWETRRRRSLQPLSRRRSRSI